MDLKNKVVLLTGGARLGDAIAQTLAARGARVALTYRASRAAALRIQKSLGADVVSIHNIDLEKPASLKKGVADVFRQWGRLDILINMASRYDRVATRSLIGSPQALSALESALAVDFKAAYGLSLLAAPHMKKSGGRIINFCDWSAASGRPRYHDYAPYYMAKSAVRALTESLALELAPKILVNAIAPGPILAPPGLSAAAYKEVIAQTPLGRWGGVEEIVKTVLFLIESNFVTGETLRVDGGRHLH